MTIGERLRELRKLGKMKQRHIAEMSGLSIPYISDVERDAINPSLLSLAKFAKAFGMPLSTLLYKVEVKLPDDSDDSERFCPYMCGLC